MSESLVAVRAEVTYVAREAITQGQLRTYAEVSGDHNPIHLDENAARAAGLSGVIAHGMLLAAFVGERALRFASDEARLPRARVKRIQTRFRAMVYLGDVVSIGGSVRSSSDDALVLDLAMRNQKGETTTTGVVELVSH